LLPSSLVTIVSFGSGLDIIKYHPIAKPRSVNRNLCFRPKKFVKEVFCAKKAKTRNAFNKRFGKKPADGKFYQLWFRYFASVSAEGSKFSR